MSFWPRLRRRSRGGRKRSSGKANPYATRDVDKYALVQADVEEQRAQFASEKGVSVSVVRFISRSSRGWVYLPDDSSVVATSISEQITSSSDSSPESSPPPPAVLLPTTRDEEVRIEEATGSGEESLASSSSTANASNGDSRSCEVSRLVLSRKDEAWMHISKTARVLLVNVLVFSRALGASTAVAITIGVVLDTWNRGKEKFQRVFSALARLVLTSLQPYLSLLHTKPIPLLRDRCAPAAKPHSSVPDMKVLPVTEDPSSINELGDSRSSSFAFPVVLTRDSSMTLFPNSTGGTLVSSLIQEESLAAALATETGVAPLVESNKLPAPKACQKLRAKLFKSSPSRNVNPPSGGENLRPTLGEEADSKIGSPSSTPNSPWLRGKKSSSYFTQRKSGKVKKDVDGDEEAEFELASSKPKVTRSHELLFFRSPKRKESLTDTDSKKNVSRSHELRFSFKSLGKKSKSHEIGACSSTSAATIKELVALPSSTVEGLEALAFPFKEEGSCSTTPSRTPSPAVSPKRKDENLKRRSSLGRMIAMESSEEKMISGAPIEVAVPLSPRGANASNATCSKSSCFMEKATVAELKPGLRKVRTGVKMPSTSESQPHEFRKVKTTVSRTAPPPFPNGELGTGMVVSREVLGFLLLLAVLGFLLLGRIPAILGTACFCLVLSQVQGFFARNLTSRDKELMRGSGLTSRTGSPANGFGYGGGSPLHEKYSELQSSEYRKRVLIEGLLDRGNRRGTL